jgi:hypothetical protein
MGNGEEKTSVPFCTTAWMVMTGSHVFPPQ